MTTGEAGQLLEARFETDIGQVAIRRLLPQQVGKVAARRTLDIMHDAYSAVQVANELITKEDVDDAFLVAERTVNDSEDEERVDLTVLSADDVVRRQAERMRHYVHDNGSTYWFASLIDGGLSAIEPIGLVKISPSNSRARRLFHRQPNAYVHDVATRSAYMRHGIGSALLHTALSDFDADREVVLDSQSDNREIDRWFHEIGLTGKATIDPLVIGSSEIAQLRLGGATVDEVQGALEARYDWIAKAELVAA